MKVTYSATKVLGSRIRVPYDSSVNNTVVQSLFAGPCLAAWRLINIAKPSNAVSFVDVLFKVLFEAFRLTASSKGRSAYMLNDLKGFEEILLFPVPVTVRDEP